MWQYDVWMSVLLGWSAVDMLTDCVSLGCVAVCLTCQDYPALFSPPRFMESELDLNDIIQEMHVVATMPDLYHLLVELSAVQSLLGLLGHDNTDILEICAVEGCYGRAVFSLGLPVSADGCCHGCGSLAILALPS